MSLSVIAQPPGLVGVCRAGRSVIGAGDPLRALAVPQEVSIRRSDGRWLMRSTTGRMIAGRFGDPVILATRAAVIDALTARVPDRVLSLGTEVTCLEPAGERRPASPPQPAS